MSSGVHIVGYTDLTSRLPTHASQFFGTNIVNLLKDMGGAENFKIDFEDEVLRKSTIVREGELTWPPPPDPVKEKPAVAKSAPAPKVESTPAAKKKSGGTVMAPPASPWLQGPEMPSHSHWPWFWPSSALPPTVPQFHTSYNKDRLSTGLLHRMAGDLECHTSSAHTIDECDQCHQWYHHRRWSVGDHRT